MNPYGDDLIVDQVIGSAYQVVKYVASNIEILIELSDFIQVITVEGLIALVEAIPELTEVQAHLTELLAIHASLPELLTIEINLPMLNVIYDMIPQLQEIYDNLPAIIDSSLSVAASREAIVRSYSEAGYSMNKTESFEVGGTITTSKQTLLYEQDGVGYSWGGSLPKSVPANSTPYNTGGISPTAWIDQSTKLLRQQLTVISGNLTDNPEWLPVPAYSDPELDDVLNAQAIALTARTELLKTDVREALRRSYAEAGYTLVAGSFEQGGLITTTTEVLLYEVEGVAYAWEGTLPKSVPPASSPASTGGVADGAWRPVGDITLRDDLSAESGASLVGFIQEGTGAVLRNAQDKMRERRTYFDYGAIGGSATNDTDGVQNALNNTKRPIWALSNQGYVTTTSLTYQGDNVLHGEGFSSAVFFDHGANATDGLIISPPADNNTRDYSGISNMYLYQASGGRHAVVVDLEAANKRMARFVCRESYMYAIPELGNYAFYVSNSTNAADKFFLAYFENNVFNGGLGLDGVGDSINITGNTFTGVNESLLFKQTTEFSPDTTAPSSLLVFERNNCSANKGIYIMEARAPKIINNNLECGAGPGAGVEGALVNIKGLTQRIVGAEITGNAILHAPNCLTGVFLGNTDGALVENNIFGLAATGSGIVVSVDSKNARIGPNIFIPTGTGREVTDLGAGTKGVFKDPTLQNGWTNVSAREVPKFIKGMDGFVRVKGITGNGTVTANTILFELPAGFRPQLRCVFQSYCYTSGDVFGTVLLRVDPDGSVRLQYASTGAATLLEVGLDAISFFAPDIP